MRIKKPEKIQEAEKKIIDFFMSIYPERFNEKARKKNARKNKKLHLSAKAYERPKIGNRGGRLQNN